MFRRQLWPAARGTTPRRHSSLPLLPCLRWHTPAPAHLRLHKPPPCPAEADPEAALWLPQQVYVGLAPPLEERHAVAASASQDGDGREAAVAAASMDAGGWRQAAASSAAAAEPQGSPGSNGTGPQRAARQWADTQQSRTAVQVLGPPQAGRQEQQQLSDPLPPQQLQEQADPLLRALQRQQQLEAPAPSQQLQQQQQEQQEQEQQQQQQQQVEPPLRQEPCTRTRPRDQLQIGALRAPLLLLAAARAEPAAAAGPAHGCLCACGGPLQAS